MSFHLLLQKLFCTQPASPDWKCNTLPKSRLQREEDKEKPLEFARLHNNWTLTAPEQHFSIKDAHLFCVSRFIPRRRAISSLSNNISVSVWACVCVQSGLEQYFSPLVVLGSRRVDNTGRGVHRESSWPWLVGGQSGTWLLNRCWRLSGQDLEINHNILLYQANGILFERISYGKWLQHE